MALWQIDIIVIPREALKLAQPLKIEDQGRYHKLWKNKNTKAAELIKTIDSFIPRAYWVNSEHWIYWKGDENNFEDNDISLTIDEKSKAIKFLSFRFDMRARNLNFINKMIEISKEHNWVFQSYNGEIFEPDVNKIPPMVVNSDYKKLIENPGEFAEELKDRQKLANENAGKTRAQLSFWNSLRKWMNL